MATTSPWNIPLFTGASAFDPIQSPFNAQSAALNTALSTAVQAGDIKFSARATAPSGWLIANGANISRTTYSVLFAAIGTAFGSGDGSTTFGLPDLRGKAPVGVKAGDLDFGTLGAKVGSTTHSHPLSANGQAQISPFGGGVLRTNRVTSPTWTSNVSATIPEPVVGSATGNTLAARLMGSTDDGSTIQPSIVLTPLIKY